MEPIDFTNPHLDGDFKSLHKHLQTREQEEDFGSYLSLESLSFSTADVSTDSGITTTSLVSEGQQPVTDTKSLYSRLLTEVKANNVQSTQTVIREIYSHDLNLSRHEFCDPENNATILHIAILEGSKDVVKYLLRSMDQKLLMLEVDFVVNNVHTNKTCLHLLAERDDVELSKLLLDQLPPGSTTSRFLQKTVLSEVEGQRPRHLAVIHIAALRGNIELIELFVKYGVDVNSKNNKNDTPILWASRGNHIKAVQRLIQLGADVHCQNDKGSSPIYWAVRYGFEELVDVLIREGKANVNQRRDLGLVAPIVLASALGKTRIVQTLIANGADVNTRITDDQTPLQHAAANGQVDVIEILLQKNARIDAVDDSGNTALMYGTKNGRLRAVCLLVQNGANLNSKNKMGQTVWDFAIENSNDMLLKGLVTLYRKRSRMSSKRFIMPAGRTPLHVAALKGDIAKVKCLFQLGVDPRTVDHSGNTYFHVAARNNCIEVLEAFLGEVDINQKNNDGETALHLAVKNGHKQAAQMLVKKAKMEIRDKSGYTPLHVAVKTSAASVELITLLVQTMINTTSWSLVNAEDFRGNSALHLACRKGRFDIIPALANLNPMKTNGDGDTPFHVAAHSGIGATLEILIEVFNQPGKGLFIDAPDHNGDTALHICAKRGDVEQVKLLISCGSDLSVKNKVGNTVLHELVHASVNESGLKELHLSVYHAIVDHAVLWWCIKRDLHAPDDDSEVYLEYQRLALIYLTSSLPNNSGHDVLRYAVCQSASDMLSALLMTEDVYCFHGPGEVVFDVTSIAPETVDLRGRKATKRESVFNNMATVDVMEFQEVGDDNQGSKASNHSCLDIIVNKEDEVQATVLLDLPPIRQMVANLWKTYQWIYGLLMVVHVVYMSCFTAYSIPPLTTFYNNTAKGIVNDKPDPMPLGAFLIWPGILLLFQFYYISVRLYYWCKGEDVGSGETSGDLRGDLSLLWLRLVKLFMSYLSSMLCIIFGAFVITWYVLYCIADFNQVNVLPVVLIVGWLFTISFTKGFETVHAFSIMLKHIVMRDMTRFLFIYSFVLIAFAFALHALFQLTPGISGNAWDSVFATFNLMLGLGEIFPEDFYSTYDAAGGSTVYVQIVYILYISLSTIILLNLLIAMMSDSYSEVKAREGTTWRVGSVRLALGLERSVPCINRFFRTLGFINMPIKWDHESERWMMTIPVKQLSSKRSVNVNETLLALNHLESRIAKLQAVQYELLGLHGGGGSKMKLGLNRRTTQGGKSMAPMLQRAITAMKPKTGKK